VSFSRHLFRAGLLAAALACACALLSVLIAHDANAAAGTTARAGHGGAGSHLAMPASPAAAALGKPRASASGLFDRAVNFRNGYSRPVWVAIMRYDTDRCGGYGDWQTKGWWRLSPGEVKQAFTTSSRYAAYYAKADDGTQWTGDRGPVYLYHDAFDSCLKIGSSAAYATVNMRLIDLYGAGLSHTINLTR
jgi:uncharacterized membrane protein